MKYNHFWKAADVTISIIIVCLEIKDGIQHLTRLQCFLKKRDDLEVIIVYARGSSGDLVSDRNVRFIHQEPTGIYSAMNFGYSEAKGKWIYFSNPGDDLLQIPCNSLLSGLVTCFPVRIIAENGEFCYVRDPHMAGRLMAPHQGMFLNKYLFDEKYNRTPFDESLSYCADLDFFLYIKSRSEKVVYYSYPEISNFRLGGVSNSYRLIMYRKLERFKVLRRYFDLKSCLKSVF